MKSKCKQNTKKPLVTALTLCISQNTFNRLCGYATDVENANAITERKIKKLAELKAASIELSKDWDNAIVNVTKKRREELLSKRQKINEEKVKLIEKLAEENLRERTNIVKEAQKLILYKNPQCRLINSALFTSECFRELQAQLDFKRMLKRIEDEYNKEYINKLRKDSEDYHHEKQIEVQKLWEKKETYRNDLKKQIENAESYLKKEKLLDFNADKKDLDEVITELKLIERCEAEQMRNKKKKLQEMFFEQINNKKLEQERLKKNEILVDDLIDAYAKTKDYLNETTKAKWKEIQAEKIRRSELMAKKCAIIWNQSDKENDERLKKAIDEIEKIEMEKMNAKQNMKMKLKADIQKYQAEYAAIMEKRKQEEENQKKWEAYQRCKKDEYNKEISFKKLQNERAKKKKIADDLKQQMKEQENLRKEETIKNDDSKYTTEALKKINEKILNYGEQVLEESRGVRPIFPIIKVIKQFKKENKLATSKNRYRNDIPLQNCRTNNIFVQDFVSKLK